MCSIPVPWPLWASAVYHRGIISCFTRREGYLSPNLQSSTRNLLATALYFWTNWVKTLWPRPPATCNKDYRFPGRELWSSRGAYWPCCSSQIILETYWSRCWSWRSNWAVCWWPGWSISRLPRCPSPAFPCFCWDGRQWSLAILWCDRLLPASRKWGCSAGIARGWHPPASTDAPDSSEFPKAWLTIC